MNWQPISEAPKDGTEVFLWVDGKMIKGFYSNTSYLWVESDGYAECQPTDFLVITPPGEQQPESAFDELKAALHADHSYAWSWHCNIAVPFMDEGGSHRQANLAAARFMKNCFDIDVTQFLEWKIEPGEQQPESVNQRLLLAAERALRYVEEDEETHGRQFGTGNELRAAIEAAKRATKGNSNAN